MVATYRARRRIKLSPTSWREPGELVPEAHTWFRVESWAHTGWLEEVDVDEDELEAALGERLDADTAAKVRSQLGLDGTPVTTARGARPAFVPARKQPYLEGESPVVEAKTDSQAERDMHAKAQPRRSTKAQGKAEAK